MSAQRRRVVVAGHDLKFFAPLQRALEGTGLFEFRQDLWQGHDRHDPAQSRARLEWAEIVVCEWCLGNAVWYSRHLRPDQRLIVRYHLQERDTVHPQRLRLDRVDRIVFVGDHIAAEAQERLGLPPGKICVIPNLVDADRFDLPKRPGAFFRLGLIGVVPQRKRLDRAIDLLERLLERDPRYRLHIKGPAPESYGWLWAREGERRYFTAQRRRLAQTAVGRAVVFDPPGDDVPEWLRDVGFVLSPSDFESFHLAVSEGMASGARPVIWDWEGAGRIHGQQHVVRDLEEAARQVARWPQAPEREAATTAAKAYVRDHFGPDVVGARWRGLLEGAAEGRTSSRRRPRGLVVVHPGVSWPRFSHQAMLRAIAAELREEAVFLVVEPAGSPLHFFHPRGEDARFLRRSARLQPARVGDNLHRLWRAPLRLRSLPAGLPRGTRRATRGERLGQQIDRVFPGLGGLPVHWISDPMSELRWLPPGAAFLYDRSETTGRGESRRRADRLQGPERLALQRARATIFSSATDLERCRPLCHRPILAPGDALYRACVREGGAAPPPSDAVRVGYLGALVDEADHRILRHAARSLEDVSFELLEVGPSPHAPPAEEAWRALAALPNVTTHRGASPAEAARRLARCQALLLPAPQDDVTDQEFLSRLWACCGTGRPVVTTARPALDAWEDLLYCAASLDEWPALVRAAATEPPGRGARRAALAEEHVWRALGAGRVAVIRGLLRPGG